MQKHQSVPLGIPVLLVRVCYLQLGEKEFTRLLGNCDPFHSCLLSTACTVGNCTTNVIMIAGAIAANCAPLRVHENLPVHAGQVIQDLWHARRVAIRLIMNFLGACYAASTPRHEMWKPPKRGMGLSDAKVWKSSCDA